MRVAMVAPPSVPIPPARYGGTERVVAELCEGLTAEGHEVVLFASGDSRPGCEVRSLFATGRWPPDPARERAHARFAAAAIREDGRFDVVHAHANAYLPLAVLPGVPTIFTLHVDRESEELAAAVRDTAATVVAISASHAARFPERGMPVVHHGLDPARCLPGPGGDALAFLGRYSAVKGPEIAVDVARATGRTLRLGGRPGPEDAAFFEDVLRPRLGPDAVDLGELDDEGKARLFGSSAALLFPVSWAEPFGLVMIEALLCGCPVIARPGGAVEEVVEEGVTGFVADTPEGLAAAVHRLPELDRAQVRARAVERFSRARMVGAYLALYEAAR